MPTAYGPDPERALFAPWDPNEVPTPLPADPAEWSPGQLAVQQYPEGTSIGGQPATARTFVWDGHTWLPMIWPPGETSPSTVPYGIDPNQYALASGEERLALQQLGGELQTRDTNRDLITAVGTDTLTQQGAANELLTDLDASRLAQEQSATQLALSNDASAYQDLDAATDAANNRDYLSMGMLGQAIEESEGQTAANLSQLRTAGDTSNALSLASLMELEDAETRATGADLGALEDYESGLTGSLDYADASLAGLQDVSGMLGDREAGYREGFIAPQELSSQAAQAYPELNARLLQEDAGEGFRRYAGLATGDGVGDESGGTGDPFDPDIASREAVAFADPTDIAAQRAVRDAYGQYIGPDAGIESARAGATADQRFIDAQTGALSDYGAYGDGAGDLSSREAQAAADQRAIDAQYDALGMFRGRSDTAIGAQERLLFEQARRAEENDRRSAMSTVLRDLRERGVLGGGAEVAAYLGQEQTTSQNRMLADMMALAQAEARAERNTGYYADLASGLRASSFGEEARRGEAEDMMNVGNRDTRLAAIGAAADIGSTGRQQSFSEDAFRTGAIDEMALADREAALRALGMQGDLATTMRGMGYEEERNRGEAWDQMALANRESRIGALEQMADLGTTQRSQSFGEMFQAGQAADEFSQFNVENSQDYQRWLAEYQRQQDAAAFARQQAISDAQNQYADRTAGIATDVYGATRDVTGDQYDRTSNTVNTNLAESQQAFSREGDIYGAYNTAIGDVYGRNADAVDTSMDVTSRYYDRAGDLSGTAMDLNAANYARTTDYLDSLRQAAGDYYGRTMDYGNRATNLASLYTDQGQAAQSGVSQAYQTQLGQRNAQDAINALEDDPSTLEEILDPAGIFR